MEQLKEEEYIIHSKHNIDDFIAKHEFRKAFELLILFLERLNHEEREYIINYYSNNMMNLGILRDYFPSK